MIVTGLEVKNWKNFKHIKLDLQDINFLIGPNASGKSNFIDIFRFLHDIVKEGGGLQKSIRDRGGISKIRCLSARKYPDVEITISMAEKAGSPESWVYSVGIMQEQRGLHRPYLRYEKILHNNKVELTRPNLRDKKDKDQLLRTYLEQPTVNQSFRAINQYFESYKYFHIIPQLIQHPQAFTGPGMPEDPYGQHFLEYLAKTNSRIRKTRLDKIQSALKIAVPRLKDLAFVQDEFGYPHLEAQYDHWRPNAGKQREDQFSDGTLRLIGLLWSLIESGDSLLLLEEPELSLNSGIIRNLVPIIFEIQQKKKNPGQVIISTHSWDLLSYSGISGDEIFIISPSSEGSKIKIASADKKIQNLLDSGIQPSDVVFPEVTPKNLDAQLTLLEF